MSLFRNQTRPDWLKAVSLVRKNNNSTILYILRNQRNSLVFRANPLGSFRFGARSAVKRLLLDAFSFTIIRTSARETREMHEINKNVIALNR